MTQAEQEQVNSEYYHVIFAGLKGGGRYLTGLREYIGSKGFVISSLTTRAGLKSGEKRLSTHYHNLAKELISRAKGRTIRVYAHSLGSIEVLDLMKALSESADMPNKALEIIFISPPGMGFRGFRGVGKVGLRLGKVIKNIGLYDQYHLYPLSTSNDEQAIEQRKYLLKVMLPNIIPDSSERNKITSELEAIDTALEGNQSGLANSEEVEKQYLKRRHILLKGLLEKIFAGQHITEEQHRESLLIHHELKNDLASRLSYSFIAFAFGFKTLTTLYRGIDSKIVEAVKYCQQQIIEVKIGIAILGKDELVKENDFENFNRLSSWNNIPIFKHFFSDVEHGSVAHRWPVIDALEAIKLAN
ncbi:MAG: hypothetical protein HXX08_05450 [Chloroflexi bacterium]|uniref:Uncharacterized protein n=1 Tax=Candidatus Chlorohelix allophototropha TaxID=3003348 RepID=A0A8T7LWR0_9CHLR|nr:hypothetical protein [Chloroflexota bacterium]WJW67182.1 hypothetical protein OZ401_000438 [Chloroflexota bacterium L227-S17]